jgi:hypothetical protein
MVIVLTIVNVRVRMTIVNYHHHHDHYPDRSFYGIKNDYTLDRIHLYSWILGMICGSQWSLLNYLMDTENEITRPV